MNKDGPGPTNPMLYDPIPEGAVQTTKIMQFVAATAGNEEESSRLNDKKIRENLRRIKSFSFYGFTPSILVLLISSIAFANK